MPKYCCFNCPEKIHDSTRELDHKCKICGNKYGFPLEYAPVKIGKYEIKKAISRGFYGATYLVEDSILGTEFVLKVIPKSIYQLHQKDFVDETKIHAQLAQGSQYIVGISGAFDQEINFSNDLKVDCHVQVLNYVNGQVLKDVLGDSNAINSLKITQIAIDLFRILDILRQKQKNHNDLHAENLIVEELTHENRRSGEIDEGIRVVAIDIGSLSSMNKAGDSPDRKGDVHWIADYLINLSEKLLRDPSSTTDQDFRIANLLQDRARLLFPSTEFVRTPNFSEVIEDLRNCFNQQMMPWAEPLRLLNFSDSYNAQTLKPWYIPSLLVDPDNQWLNKISGSGPMVVTGMRGCGKTMMLRALEFHARAQDAKLQHLNDPEKQVEEISKEPFVAFYISCDKLLHEIGKEATDPLHQPFTKLFIRYCIEAIIALRHLNDIKANSSTIDFHTTIAECVSNNISNCSHLLSTHNDKTLERELMTILFSLNRGEDKYSASINPSSAFPSLANTIRNSSKYWNNKYVLFLLDDVSTRYLGEHNIENLLSSLIFQSEDCAFKITSEVQTVELLLYSPGKVEKAKKGRDFETFDLGSAVNEKIRNRQKDGGKNFVANILKKRADGNPKHPKIHPIHLLGDKSLKSIAESIVTRGINKSERKKIYQGISALAGVCVGDIGDIINLYDRILKYFLGEQPVPADKQNECFQDLCSVRLHEVNRRGSDYKDFALTFAQASHELLIKSSKDGSHRLRQYYSIYVRITTGDTETQYAKIRELLDAGIFVYSGGASTPRTLGNDTNPINQFKLTYRKLYGVSNLIGLSQADRFELSGKDLEEWLQNPAKGKDILLKNVGGGVSNVDTGDDDDDRFEVITGEKKDVPIEGFQKSFDFNINSVDQIKSYYDDDEIKKLIEAKKPKVEDLSTAEIEQIEFDYLILGLGFEERTLDSAKHLIQNTSAKIVLLIKYSESGYSKEILKEIKLNNKIYEIIDFNSVITSFDAQPGKYLCDITGLSKSLIYNFTRNVLANSGQIWIAHTKAETYSPSNEEIEENLKIVSKQDLYQQLESISEVVKKGESGPWEKYDLLFSDSDESKRNVLIGFINSKYEKLFTLLDYREFEKIVIFCPEDKSSRSKLSKLASNLVAKKYSNSDLINFDTKSINYLLEKMTEAYQLYYIDQDYNFEIALTGSKTQSISAAAISAAFKVSHCWYVKPSNWNTNTFSKGIGNRKFYTIRI